MFVKNLEGTLMEMTEVPDTRFRYVVWFDYTRQNINAIQEGALLAVPNFASNGGFRNYSVLQVVTLLPTHYALQGGATSGYPGFVIEAARSAAEDWESQEHTSTEDTTKIRVVAVPTNLEIVEDTSKPDADPSIQPESNMAMVGAKARVLDTDYSNRIANNGIDRENEPNLTTIGQLARDKNVDVLLRIEELYRTHFAIFGFTGVGKSNLLSTIVAKVMADTQEPLKLVFFDLMSEYTVLLLDQLLGGKAEGRILTLGRHTLPEPLFQHINKLPGAPSLDEAARTFVRYSLLPKGLLPVKRNIAFALRDLVAKEKIKFYHEAQSISVYDLFFTDLIPWAKSRQQAKFMQRVDLIKRALRAAGLGSYKVPFTVELAQKIKEALVKALDGTEFGKDGDFGNHLAKLDDLQEELKESFAAGVTLADLVTDLNDTTKSSLWIIQAHNPNHMRSFAKALGEQVYEHRRLRGLINPLVSFIFDEADEFIRRDAQGTYAESAEIAQTLARRGRKFGLGIGIATQRIRYLDTNIMSQPHTYFVSKLPRLSDRQAVAEGFGLGEEMFNQTFKFKKGQWLLMSHGATGLEAVPIPIQAVNANDRVADFVRSQFKEGK